MSTKFKLTGSLAGKTTTLAGRYEFVDGELECSNADAENLKSILCNYYACKVEVKREPKSATSTQTSLSTELTQSA